MTDAQRLEVIRIDLEDGTRLASEDIHFLFTQLDEANKTIAEKDTKIEYLKSQSDKWRNLMGVGVKIMQGSAMYHDR